MDQEVNEIFSKETSEPKTPPRANVETSMNPDASALGMSVNADVSIVVTSPAAETPSRPMSRGYMRRSMKTPTRTETPSSDVVRLRRASSVNRKARSPRPLTIVSDLTSPSAETYVVRRRAKSVCMSSSASKSPRPMTIIRINSQSSMNEITV